MRMIPPCHHSRVLKSIRAACSEFVVWLPASSWLSSGVLTVPESDPVIFLLFSRSAASLTWLLLMLLFGAAAVFSAMLTVLEERADVLRKVCPRWTGKGSSFYQTKFLRL